MCILMLYVTLLYLFVGVAFGLSGLGSIKQPRRSGCGVRLVRIGCPSPDGGGYTGHMFTSSVPQP